MEKQTPKYHGCRPILYHWWHPRGLGSIHSPWSSQYHMEVSWVIGLPPHSSISLGISTINHPFNGFGGTTIYGNHHIGIPMKACEPLADRTFSFRHLPLPRSDFGPLLFDFLRSELLSKPFYFYEWQNCDSVVQSSLEKIWLLVHFL